MSESLQIAELAANCTASRATLAELLKTYDLAALGQEVQDSQFKDIYNRVLAENEFFASAGCSPRCGIEKGARILDSKFDFLLSEEDFHRLYDLCRPIFIREGLTDENDCYITNWLTLKVEARQAVIDYTIQNVLPQSFRAIFWENRLNYTQMEKLLDLARKMAA